MIRHWDREARCIICREPYEGFGHNPDPVAQEGRCCDHCNWAKVIPARIARMQEAARKPFDNDNKST